MKKITVRLTKIIAGDYPDYESGILEATLFTHSYRTRKLKKLVVDTVINLIVVDEETRKEFAKLYFTNIELRELVRTLDMMERQERIDRGELNETDLQVPG